MNFFQIFDLLWLADCPLFLYISNPIYIAKQSKRKELGEGRRLGATKNPKKNCIINS